jgi:lipopolysaccharide export system ATP-binding protein
VSALSAEHVSVSLGEHEILHDVSFAVARGEVLGVLGPSGAGKSTLFRLLAGELWPSSGRVLIGERDVTREPLWRRARAGLGYVPQTPSVLFDLTLRSNLVAFERAARVAARPAEERAKSVELEQRLEVRAAELSGGERRRLELLRALIAEPSVLICDEPLTGVDPVAAAAVGRLIRAQAEAGRAVIVADHRVHEALAFCDRVLLLVGGRVELESGPEGFLDHPAVRRRYLG